MAEVTNLTASSVILVVDDTKHNLTLMRDLLGPYYTVKLAASGAEGLDIAKTTPPDLILLDIMMPGMDGYEVCRQLKAMPECKDIPVIFLTAATGMQNEEIGLALGAVDYLTKPISRSIVLARVRSQLALKATHDALRAQIELSEQSNLRVQNLLYNIFPIEIADELSSSGQVLPVRHESASILFTDFSGFTHIAATMPASYMVSELNEIFAAFDDICDELGVEKIKTIGDAYMAAAGLPRPCADHASRCVRAGLRMHQFLNERNVDAPFKWPLRVGIHTGPVISGVVGKRKFAFDVWGDTVNVACRMEMSGQIGKVNISAYTYDQVRDDFDCEYRGKVNAKGKGLLDMYFVKSASN
ncbi:adenylate/guanylate cyclase domain-containing protein [Massilia glaciei]|uniref:Adenylate/guanylate cyclase domain-containing response regulator n=2 Tax=Pseudomonadati TaxID=3379134 RepID=A0A2U2HMS1_9BURK|nr:adenylate/guanylate cyclase domain-containing protein [Massilia glaciei]PWF48726.1 adenylate/guanylate cyclase domain-containing response regulator [Massilia glaciei]